MNLSKHATLLSLVAATTLIGCNRGAHEPDKNPDNPKVDQQDWDSSSTQSQNDERGRSASNTSATESKRQANKDQSGTDDRVAKNDETREHAPSTNSDFGPVLATPNSQVGGEQRLSQTRPAQQNSNDQDQDQSEPAQNDPAPKRGVVGRVGQGLSNAGGAVKGAVLGVGAATGYYGSELYHAWRPTDDTTGRRDALEAIHDRTTETRAAAPSELASLKDKIAQTSPNSERISSIITSDNDTKRLLVDVLTEQNPESVAGASERLVGEVFKVADDADAKVQQIQFSLRDLANGGAYDSAASARVSYLQTELDKRIAADDLQSTLKRNSFLILTTAAGAVFAGYNGVERTAETLRAIPFRRGFTLAEDGVTKIRNPRFWDRLKRKVVATAEDGTEKATDAGNSVMGRAGRGLAAINAAVRRPFVRTSAKELVLADVRDVLNEAAKIDKTIDVEAVIRQLKLRPIAKKNLPAPKAATVPKEGEEAVADVASQLSAHKEFAPTAKPGLYVAVTNEVKQPRNQKLAADEYQIVFQVARDPKAGLESGTQVFASAPLKNQAAYDLAQTLKTAPAPQRELKVFDVSGATPIPASEADTKKLAEAVLDGQAASELNQAGAVVVEGPRAKLGDTTETVGTVADAKIAANQDLKQIAEDTTAGAKRLQKRAADRVEKTWNGTTDYAKRSVAAIKGDKPFDPAKAVIGGTMVGLPAYLWSRSAYFQGRRIGEGYDALYLEDLIPADRLQKVVIQPDGTAEPAR